MPARDTSRHYPNIRIMIPNIFYHRLPLGLNTHNQPFGGLKESPPLSDCPEEIQLSSILDVYLSQQIFGFYTFEATNE